MSENNMINTYINLFDETKFKYYNKTAIKAYNDNITFKNLDLLISKIASNLNIKIKDKNKTIALCSDGTIFHFATMIACMKIGVTFINLDLKNPKNYIQNIIENLKIKTLVISKKSNDFYDDIKNLFEEVIYETYFKENHNFSKMDSKVETIFIVPTSGSTGTPKYVKKKMNSLMKSHKQFKERVGYLYGKVIEQSSPLNFSFGLELSLIFLANGNTICINERKEYLDIKYLFKNIEKNNVEIAFWPAPIIKLLSRQAKLIEEIPKSLKYIIVGGEPIVVSADLVFEFHKKGIKLLNNYGCTEIGTVFFGSMDITIFNVEEFNKVAVGQPLDGFKALILNENLEECEKGDLYIKADKFENEYFELEEKQDEKFVKLKKYSNDIFCNMGDICEFKDGKYYVIGRDNNCINVRGYRVEIENIEFFITKILKGNECCVVPFINKFNETNIICFYSSDFYDPFELRDKLEKELPEYMIPKVFIQLTELYHLKNGKIDREKMKKLYYEKYTSIEKNSKNIEESILSDLEKVLSFKIKDENKMQPFKQLGLDSLGFTDFISIIESKEKINIEDTKLVSFFEGNIKDIVNYIVKKRLEIEDRL